MGIAIRSLIANCCNYDATKLAQISVRFSSPFLPGASSIYADMARTKTIYTLSHLILKVVQSIVKRLRKSDRFKEGRLMQPILKGMRIIEASAFIAAPMCGTTLAQLGAEVIRFDPILGGLDYARWPITKNGDSIYWAEMNKGKKSIAINTKSDEGKELISELITLPGDQNGIFSTNLPATGWLSYESLKKTRSDLIQHEIIGNRNGRTALDYTVNAKVDFL